MGLCFLAKSTYLPVLSRVSKPVAYVFFLQLLLLLHLILVLDEDKLLFFTVSFPLLLLPSLEYAQVWLRVCKVGVELI